MFATVYIIQHKSFKNVKGYKILFKFKITFFASNRNT